MRVILSHEAESDLKEIWNWNAANAGARHADRYISFLEKRIYELTNSHRKGKIVEARPEFRYIIVKRRSGGYGHVVVYKIDSVAVRVANVFHTAQNWQEEL